MIRLQVHRSDRQFIRPAQVKRAARLAINQVTSEAHKELGREVPLAHGTSITGYRKVRSKKVLAKAKGSGLRGIVWQGTMKIQAIYAGRPRKVKGGIRAGKHFFANAFKATMKKSGHVGIFRRKNGKLDEVRIELTQAKAIIQAKARKALTKLPEAFRYQYKKQIKR